MPFDEFPFEIIQRIFTFCCRGVTIKDPQPSDARIGTTQVTLSLVCSRWKEIVLNTRGLWSDVEVICNTGGECDSTASIQFAKHWLNRAGRMPISLTVIISTAQKTQIAAISQLLLSSFHIKNLNLQSIGCPFVVPTNNTYCLETLHLSLTGSVPPRTVIFPRLPEMPSLKELYLTLRPEDFVDRTNLYLIPWFQLRVFTLHKKYWPIQILFNILEQCKSLVECTLLGTSTEGQRERNIVLPNLESLVLDMVSESSPDPIIRSLTLPRLKSLDVRSCDQVMTSTLDPAAINVMVQRSGFEHITYFSLSRTTKPVDVSALLKTMPALKSVKLHGPLIFRPGTIDDLATGMIGSQLEDAYFGFITDDEIRLICKAIRKRCEKAKTTPDIKAFISVTGSLPPCGC